MKQQISTHTQFNKLNSISTVKMLASIVTCLSLFFVVLNFYRTPISLSLFERANQSLIAYNMLDDDTFYYLQIAKNIIEKSLSSFDGITQTNGYHPLWMLIIIGLGKVIPIDTTYFIWLFMILIISIIAVGSFFFRKLQKELRLDNTYSPVTIAYFFSGLLISQGGMEVCLIYLFLPLFFLLTYRAAYSSNDFTYFAVGLTASLIILSRLDAIILVSITCLVFLYYVYSTKTTSISWKKVFVFLVGLTPFFAYLFFNLISYHNIVPISGQAKALYFDNFIISQRGFYSILDRILTQKYFLVFFGTTVLSLPLVIMDLVRKKTLKDLILIIIMFYPFIYFVFYLIRSDWPFWDWYYYPLSISFAFSLLVLEEHIERKISSFNKFKEFSVLFIALVLSIVLVVRYIYDTPRQYKPTPPMNIALKIRNFARSNPGVYAMGDRAGSVGFLLQQPLIHLEGLVSDSKMIKNISMQRNLYKVLNEYSVNYYIVSNPKKVDNCWHVEEPAQPGPFAPRMRAIICDEPVFHYEGNGKVMIFLVKNSETAFGE